MKTCAACNHQNSVDALICESCGDRLEISSGWEKTTIRSTHVEAFAPGYLVAGRYEIEKEIGRGGMGVVYRVKDIMLQSREMALKMIHPQLVELPEARQRFEQEVNTCLDLLHPNIVRVHNLEEWQGLKFFTMEYIAGRSLQELIDERKAKRPPFTLSETAAIILPLLDALASAHQYTIHRDIKPDNIIVIGNFPNVSIKVLDFGIAKTLSASRFTQTAQVLGTAFYMAPEQMSGGEIDNRTDLYSTGMILNEMLTGEMAVGRFRLPGEIYTDLPKELDEILEKALAPAPEQRFPDAAAMQQALKKAVSISEEEIKVKPVVETHEASTVAERGPQQIQEEISAAKPMLAGSSRKLLPWVYACAVVMMVLLAAGVFFSSRDKKDSVTTAETTEKEQIQPKRIPSRSTPDTLGATLLKTANEAYDCGNGVDYEGAFVKYLSLAKLGHAESAFRVAYMYDFAQGVPHNHRRAVDWYLRAAELGHGEAQYKIASLYDVGPGIEHNIPEAYKWYWLCRRNKDSSRTIKRRVEIRMDSFVTSGRLGINQSKHIESQAQKWQPKPSLNIKED